MYCMYQTSIKPFVCFELKCVRGMQYVSYHLSALNLWRSDYHPVWLLVCICFSTKAETDTNGRIAHITSPMLRYQLYLNQDVLLMWTICLSGLT